MKRSILALLVAVAMCGVVSAQKLCVIDSEKVFKSIAAYNEAMTSLDKLSKEYQQTIEAKYKQVEALYNQYQAQKASLTEAARQSAEQQILALEQEAQQLQQSLFGTEGQLMKRRVELIEPVQKRVFAAIEKYAEQNGYDLVLDKASNVSLLYSSKAVNHTQQIIEMVK